MKIRCGFVSNSSSSSFVVFGFRAKDVLGGLNKLETINKFAPNQYDKNIKKFGLDDAFNCFCSSTNFGVPGVGYLYNDGDDYIGVVLADVNSDGGYLDDEEMALEDITAKVDELKKSLGINGNPRLFVGTRVC